MSCWRVGALYTYLVYTDYLSYANIDLVFEPVVGDSSSDAKFVAILSDEQDILPSFLNQGLIRREIKLS